MKRTNRVIAYYRVSTKKQEESGLGLDSQQFAVAAYAERTGAKVLAEYTEAETGKRSDRPELAKAITHAKRTSSVLVVAKLDRLARNVAFTSALMESGVEFIACDMPDANRLTIHILAAVAEDEAERISQRTKAALATAKRKGTLLGAANPKCRNLTDRGRTKGQRLGVQAMKAKADAAAEELRETLTELRPAFSYAQIATILNMRGERTRRGMEWTDVAVMRVCKRLDLE